MEQKVVPYGHADETIEKTSGGILYKVFQTPYRLFVSAIMAGILIGTGYWLAYETGSSLWPYRFLVQNGQLVKKTVIELLSPTGVNVPNMISYAINNVSLAKLIIGAVFPVGLIAILIGGADLWTSNPQLVVYGYARRKYSLNGLLYNWTIVYLGNLAGSIFLAFMATYGSGYLLHHPFMDTALSFALHKVHNDYWHLFWAGVGCNFLVNLAVWLWLRSKDKDIAGQVLVIWFPIFAFVAIGFEHAIANMFAVPAGVFISAKAFGIYGVSFHEFFFKNLIPVTFGNLIGGFVFIALVYLFLGYNPGSKYGEMKPGELIKLFIDVAVICAITVLVLGAVVPGIIATAVEKALGLTVGAHLSNPTLALVPGFAVIAYCLIMPIVAYKVFKPFSS